ncbi:MAG TPA: hypothetical protein VK966_09050 [Longimicrobiales bacterium]|nr:hypothetical protein [Longimicrobiales bacterium]
MRRGVLLLATAVAAATMSACGGGEVAVLAQIEGEAAEGGEAEAVALSDLPVRLLPYDRDALFDSLTQAYPEPEPQLPDSVAALQERVIQRYAEWQEAQSRWGLLRDSLQTLSNRMNQMDQQSGEYFAMFQDFNDLEGELGDLEDTSDEAFEEFTMLQSRFTNQSQEIRLQQQAWADEAFMPFDSIVAARLDESGLEELADTTAAQGIARFNGVKPGQWWVHARFNRGFDELYWNEPIEVVRGEQVQIELNEANAEVRQSM